MAKPYEQYAKEVATNLHYGATWPAGSPLKLGVTGTFEGGVFVPKSNLASVGIKFNIEKDNRPYSHTFASANDVSVRFKLKGEPGTPFRSLTDAKAGVAISFSRKNAVVFSATGCYEHRIADIFALVDELTRRVQRGSWREDWAVITHLVVADSATIILSSSRGGTVELEVAASVGTGPTKLADLSTGVGLSFADKMNQIIVATQGLTPLFHSMRLDRSFWTGKLGPVLDKSLELNKARTAKYDAVDRNAWQQVDYEDPPAKSS